MDAGTINILLKADDQASKVLDGAAEHAGGLGGKLGEVARTAGGFVVGSALTNLPGKLLDMAKGAADDAASTAKLEQAVRNAEGSFDGHAAAIDDAITSGQQLAFSDDDVRDALALMTSTTGDADEALRRLHTAQDLARGTGMDLATASKLIGRVSDENINVLSRYGIQVDKNATAQDLLNAVDGKFGGQAATFAASDAGKMAIMTDKVGELQEQLGAYLIPVLALVVGAIISMVDTASRILGVFQPVVSFIQGNLTPILIFLTPAIIGLGVAMLTSLVPALIASTVALWAQVAAWIALNIGMLPIIGIFVLIGAALVLLYLAWQSNFLGIQGIVSGLIAFVTPAFDAVVNLFQVIIPAAIGVMLAVWQTITAIVSGVIGIVSALLTGDFAGAWNAARDMVSGVISAIGSIVSGLPGAVAGFIADMATQAATLLAGWATDAATKAAEFLSGLISAITSLPGDVAGIVSDMASGAVELLSGLVSDGVGLAGDLLSGLLDAISSMPGDVAGIVTDMAGQAMEILGGLLTDATGKAGEILSGILDAISSLPDKAYTTFDNARTRVTEVLQDLISKAPGWGRDILQGIITGITELFGVLSGAMSAMRTAVTSSVSDAGSWLYSAGRDIISGLIGGIEDMAGRAADAAINVVKGAVDAAKGYLGIGSPSKRAHDEIGRWWTRGVAGGMLSAIGFVERAGRTVSQAAMTAPPTALMPGGVGISLFRSSDIGTGGSDGGRRPPPAAGVTVNYNGPVTINARDRADADRSSRDIGWAVSAALRARGAA